MFLEVYLSGGFHSDWQDRVMNACAGLEIDFLNPLSKETDPKTLEWVNKPLTEEQKEEMDKTRTQSPWWPMDRLAIEEADVVFVYLEDYRPAMLGTGTVFEMGMAYALGKVVIIVNEIEHRYYREFTRIFSSYPTLDAGIEALKKCIWLST
jgi:nucleoside 2-deoxyribosyltransferase